MKATSEGGMLHVYAMFSVSIACECCLFRAKFLIISSECECVSFLFSIISRFLRDFRSPVANLI